VASTLAGMGLVVVRIAGRDRTETATKVADYELDPNSKLAVDNRALTFDSAHVNLARGDDYPDALAGGPHAGEELSPVLLTSSSTVLGPMTRAWLTTHSGTLLDGHLFGGPAAISTTVQSDATTAARGG
jgi:putative cell wall-binding protein